MDDVDADDIHDGDDEDDVLLGVLDEAHLGMILMKMIFMMAMMMIMVFFLMSLMKLTRAAWSILPFLK